MTDILSLIENSKKTKKESIASTVRMPEKLYTFIEELALELDLSKHEVMLKLLQQGADAAEQALKKVGESEPKFATGFHILNTNKAHSDEDHDWMLTYGAAAAFYEPWKLNINRIKKDEVVFLYENGKGIVAYGRGTGTVQMRDHEGSKDECHYQVLDGFKILEQPLSAAAIKKVLGRNVVFLRVMSGMPDGQKVLEVLDSMPARS